MFESFTSEQGILAGPGQSTRAAGSTAVMKDKEVIGSTEPSKLRYYSVVERQETEEKGRMGRHR